MIIAPIDDARNALYNAIFRDTRQHRYYKFAPARIEPPCTVITEGSPLVSNKGKAHGDIDVNLEVMTIAARADSERALNLLDSMQDRLCGQLSLSGFIFEADPYEAVTAPDGQQYVSCTTRVTITTQPTPEQHQEEWEDQ